MMHIDAYYLLVTLGSHIAEAQRLEEYDTTPTQDAALILAIETAAQAVIATLRCAVGVPSDRELDTSAADAALNDLDSLVAAISTTAPFAE